MSIKSGILNKIWTGVKSLISKIKLWAIILLVVCTLLSYSAVIVNPDVFPLPALAGIAFPYLLMVDVVFTLLLILAKKRSAIVMILLLAVGYKFIQSTVQLNPLHYIDDFDENDESFSIMTFNVRLLDRYKWIKGKADTRTKIFEFLKYESPDITCFQEFYNNAGDSITNEDIIRDLLQAKYIARDYNPSDTLHNTNKGYRIFSQFPLANVTPIFDTTDNLIGIYADTDFRGHKARIFNFHLRSIKLGYDDYDFIDQIQTKNNSEQVSGIMNIYRKLRKAYALRVSQAAMLRKLIDESPYPVVLCGDFNEPPVSYCYNKILGKDLVDAFCQSGTGWGGTIMVKLFSFRIDYIFHSPQIESRSFSTHHENLSDHYSVSCKLKFIK